MSTDKRNDSLHKASSILSVSAILLTIALFVRMETVVHDTKMMDSQFTLEIQNIKDALKEVRDTRQARVKENFDALSDVKYKSEVVRRSLQRNRSDSDLEEIGDGLRRYMKSLVTESMEFSCLAPNKVCIAGAPGPKGNQGNRGKRGPKGTKGKKGTQGIMGTPGEPGKQGIKGDLGTHGIKGEKGDAGAPGIPGPKGDAGKSISAPEVIVSPTLLTVTQYQTATFHCSADGNPKPSVSWSKISGTGQKDVMSNKLQITSAGYNDSGSYVCTATNILGKAMKVVKLFVEGTSWTYGSTSNAFIFSLRNKEGLGPFKSMVTNPSYAIYRGSSYGPKFGNGYDIYIANNANSNTNSYSDFGQHNTYSVPSGVQDKNTILSGTRNFTPDEVEVFYLG